MQLCHLRLHNIRIIESMDVELDPGFNYIVGENGSGKTSVLEGANILSTGSSFRTNNPAHIITHGKDRLQAISSFRDASDLPLRQAGIERSRNGTFQVKLDLAVANRLSDLTQAIPLLALHPESHQLILGGPQLRRKFLDWGVFHVEPNFIATWRSYRRVLEQRNAALKEKGGRNTIEVWNRALAENGERLHQYRSDYVQALSKKIAALSEESPINSNVAGGQVKKGEGGHDHAGEENSHITRHAIQLKLRSGWSDGANLLDELTRHHERDRHYRNTTIGPHRAELVIKQGDYDVRDVLSRGQQKVLVYVLKLAQAMQLKKISGKKSIFLCDDLPSELDEKSRHWVFQQFSSAKFQVLITGIHLQNDELANFQGRLFTMEDGKLSRA